jgi:hypothetical protein
MTAHSKTSHSDYQRRTAADGATEPRTVLDRLRRLKRLVRPARVDSVEEVGDEAVDPLAPKRLD